MKVDVQGQPGTSTASDVQHRFIAARAREGKQTVRQATLTAAIRERIEDMQDAMAQLCPALMPTIIPPKPWTGTSDGGYHPGLFRRLRPIKTWSNELVEELDNADLSRSWLPSTRCGPRLGGSGHLRLQLRLR